MLEHIHVVVGVFGVTSASELDKSVTGSREWFVERSSFDGIGLEGGMIATRARKTMGKNQSGEGQGRRRRPHQTEKNRTS